VDLRPAHLDRHVQAVALIDAFGERLIEAAVLGLRIPIGHEDHLVGRDRAAGDDEHNACQNRALTAPPPLARHEGAKRFTNHAWSSVVGLSVIGNAWGRHRGRAIIAAPARSRASGRARRVPPAPSPRKELYRSPRSETKRRTNAEC